MRNILIGLLITAVVILGAYFGSNRYPEKAEWVVAKICSDENVSWFCETTRNELQFEDNAGNRFSCKLNGCCSGSQGIDLLDLNTNKVICRDGGESPSCKCERL